MAGKAIIVGAGLAGSLLAGMLARDGWTVELVERRQDPRARGFIGGRSINLALSVRGLTALARVGLDQSVLQDAIRMPGRMMHDDRGALTFQPYSANADEAIHSVSRGGLNITLLQGADAHNAVTMRFGARCEKVDPHAGRATFRHELRGDRFTLEGDLIVGADGAFSAVRDTLRVMDRFDFSQSYLGHGYKELEIPPAEKCAMDPKKHDGFAMDPNALHIWPRGGEMMIALPNADRTFTCTLFWDHDDLHALDTDAKVGDKFARVYPDVPALMPALLDDYRRNPVSSLVTVRCSPWNRGKVTLLGDAAHAIVPFFGQGMNAAFEDCRVLAEMLEEHGSGSVEGALARFAKAREPNANAIADMALENFIEMRDKVADPAFLFRKRVDAALTRIDPEGHTPRYNLVSFTNTPYAEAKRDGDRVIAVAERIAGELRASGGESMNDDALDAAVRERLGAVPSA